MRIHVFPCLSDNFGVLLHDPVSGETASIDAPEAAAVQRALDETGWKLTQILGTHSHPDHFDGIAELAARHGAKVTIPEKARGKVTADVHVKEGDTVSVGSATGEVWETPGHCADHVCYVFRDARLAFVGDVLFALGCGRVFDNAYGPMWHALERLAELPADTQVFFGHEYTLANAKFARSIEPNNPALEAEIAKAEATLAEGGHTCPTTIGAERAANPFLRASDPAIAAAVGMAGQPAAVVFQELRERKNRF